MNTDHADLAALTRRLADIPAEFLGEPAVAGHGEMAVAAIVVCAAHAWAAGIG